MEKYVLLVFALCSISSLAQQAPAPSDPKPQATAATAPKTYRQLNSETKDGTYTNHYFGFSYTLPAGWDSHDEETKKRVLEMGQDALKKAEEAPAQPGPEQGFFMLLLTTPKDVLFPQVTLMAQDVVMIPQIKTGGDFIELLNEQFKQQPKYSVTKPSEKFSIADREFYKSEFTNGPAYQAAIFTIMRRHAVGFILTAGNDKDLQDLISGVQKMKFEAPKEADAK
jgi:hypothetical protein